MSDVIVGNGIVQLDVQDTAKLKAVLFGGEPWLVYCVNPDTAPGWSSEPPTKGVGNSHGR